MYIIQTSGLTSGGEVNRVVHGLSVYLFTHDDLYLKRVQQDLNTLRARVLVHRYSILQGTRE